MKKKALKSMIPLQKQTKKQQKAHHLLKRGSWGNVSPVTRVAENKKAYRRQDRRQAERSGMSGQE